MKHILIAIALRGVSLMLLGAAYYLVHRTLKTLFR